jgi:hypothetical protein
LDKEEHFLVEAMKEYFGELTLPERNLIASSINKMNKDVETCSEEFSIGSYETYEWLEDECIMVFSDNGKAKLIAKATYVGSIVCREWRWSWAEEEKDINKNCKELMLGFKSFVQQYDFPYLKIDTFSADERIGWVMSAIASFYAKSKLIYKIDRCEATEFYLFSNIVKM